MQYRGHPCEQRENFQKFFRVSGDDPAAGVDLTGAFLGQGAKGGGQMGLHPGQRTGRIDQPSQCLKPRQPVRAGLPPPREKHRLPSKSGIKLLPNALVLTVHQKKRVIDPADLPSPGQIRGPTRAGPAPISGQPIRQPVLRQGAPTAIGHSGQMIHPLKPVQLIFKGVGGGIKRPGACVGCLNQHACEYQIAGHQLPPPCIAADCFGFGLRDKAARDMAETRLPGGQPVEDARSASGAFPQGDGGRGQGLCHSGVYCSACLAAKIPAPGGSVTAFAAAPYKTRPSRHGRPKSRGADAGHPRGWPNWPRHQAGRDQSARSPDPRGASARL